MTSSAKTTVVAASGLVLLAATAALSLLVGSQGISPAAVLGALRGAGDDLASGIVAARVDRTLIAVVVGACIALAGVVLQGLTRNPIAEPGILGLNSGAALLVVIGIRLGLLSDVVDYLWTALVGVVITGLVVHLITLSVPVQRQPMTTALAGAAILAATSSIMVGLLVSDDGALDVFRYWQVGSVAGKDASIIVQVLPFLLVGLVLTLASGRTLNTMALGDDVARALGQRVLLARGSALVGALLLTATACALAGPIAFVGLAVPHVVRLLGGSDNRRVLLGSLLLGPSLLLLADSLGRVVSPPSEVQVGVMTAVIGAPALIIVARRAVRG
ncbi:iron chelate uptake ABC transporter family permease subunit [Janibacter melonis]|uniref:Iron chelate uptake ABC transporter family permease subunit n=1 Tax=Janibacter melonis TaxID=262209 RepID=A0A5P8FK55_9MICO|nr:iron ABC transporter permease [Janibacter melonis]MBD5829884.1 iron ABC transporter permease [Janibacter melonis]QFQ29222.2 iron chelate uptake ABC transporter family permease subunit [Janibacter melonis]